MYGWRIGTDMYAMPSLTALPALLRASVNSASFLASNAADLAEFLPDFRSGHE